MRTYCEDCGIYNWVNEDGICADCIQESLDEDITGEEDDEEEGEDLNS
jgi:hypothetical protein